MPILTGVLPSREHNTSPEDAFDELPPHHSVTTEADEITHGDHPPAASKVGATVQAEVAVENRRILQQLWRPVDHE
jgi:hypothetical protein